MATPNRNCEPIIYLISLFCHLLDCVAWGGYTTLPHLGVVTVIYGGLIICLEYLYKRCVYSKRCLYLVFIVTSKQAVPRLWLSIKVK
jgi:hypothetical protein